MPLSPRYGDSPIISIAGSPRDQLVPLARQRRRFESMLTELRDDEWRSASRCAGWSTKDVVAHLAGVNVFWAASVRAGLAGTPTRVLSNFDPVRTPARMVAETRDLTPDDVLDRFVSSNEVLLDLLGGLGEDDWSITAETPPGHLSIRLLASHALWDAWTHERDVGIPLSRIQPIHDDEVSSSLRYVSALTAALGLLAGSASSGSFGVEASNPELQFSVHVAGTVEVRDGTPPEGAPMLHGDTVALVEAISTRVPFATDVPEGWAPLIEGLGVAFTTGT